MTKFKVGDKVRILDVDSIWLGYNIEIINGAATVEEVNSSGRPRLKCVSGMPLIISAREMQYIEKLPQNPTKNQRITTLEQNVVSLESEVAELKAKVEALEKAQKQSLVYEGSAQFINGERVIKVAPTCNEQRKAIIAEAKAFIEDVTHRMSQYGHGNVLGEHDEITTGARGWITKAEFVVNAEKRTVVAILRLFHGTDIVAKAIAKCAPDDVFNADIGKAIALGRALGLDVSRFEQAVKPTEVVVGQVVEDIDDELPIAHGKVTGIEREDCWGPRGYDTDEGYAYLEHAKITNDTEAQY